MLIVSNSIKYKENDTAYWKDPGRDNNKQSLVDLTAKGGAALDNDGFHNVGVSGAEPIVRPVLPFSKSTFEPSAEKKKVE